MIHYVCQILVEIGWYRYPLGCSFELVGTLELQVEVESINESGSRCFRMICKLTG